MSYDCHDDDELLALLEAEEAEVAAATGSAGNTAAGAAAVAALRDEAVRLGTAPLDPAHAGTWVFPAHPEYPEREYQLAIAGRALFENTLVSLPTGLGKTFIAAVVMHNYRRWFPSGKVVFMAPTRPLVAQQVEACHKIVGIPAEDTAQMQGSVAASLREGYWRERAVIYCTPQMLQNDLEARRVDARRIVLLVLDEAHRATGKYAYCEVVRLMEEAGARFRLLALSATPGSDLKRVQGVIDALRISAIEARADGDPDVAPYTHNRTIDRITVSISSDLKVFQSAFAAVLRPLCVQLHAAKLISHRDPMRLSQVGLCKVADEARKNPGKYPVPQPEWHGVMSALYTLQRLQPAMSELLMHGTHAFWCSLQRFARERKGTQAENTLLRSHPWRQLTTRLAELERAGRHILHPKLVMLGDKVRHHFERHDAARDAGVAAAVEGSASGAAAKGGGGTRVIIFTETRPSVDEIVKYLRAHAADCCRPAAFVGQGGSRRPKGAAPGDAASSSSSSSTAADAGTSDGGPQQEATTSALSSSQGPISITGQSQKQQQAVVARFRSGRYNTLVATCIGEEGLDIGDVGLIVLFDASGSPVRTVQRIGRTGRQKAGEIVALVTPGAESAKFEAAFRKYRHVASALRSNASRFRMSDASPVMVPSGAGLVRKRMDVGELRMSQVAGAQVPSAPDGGQSRASQPDIRAVMSRNRAGSDAGALTASQAAFISRAYGGQEGPVAQRVGTASGTTWT
ncbi:hypothetical protein FNF27_06127 [Cafeteria roenbergensis]|uniref:ATP-dependent DNA helicase n=1 Tax=Cafeteria roenbergensis TaxID=33653 RepID=A0A5A8E2U0_CAFRO|nr:hypothetical protein FNF27_06127 [Cafeteria roenbergensis]